MKHRKTYNDLMPYLRPLGSGSHALSVLSAHAPRHGQCSGRTRKDEAQQHVHFVYTK